MARRTLEDLERDPKNVRLEELLAVLRAHGCEVRAGTRHGYTANCGGRTLTIPRHDRIVKPVYVRLAVKVLKGE